MIPYDPSFWSGVLGVAIGAAVLLLPRLTRYLVAVYLIAFGVLNILGYLLSS
jgi:hypothetical protein